MRVALLPSTQWRNPVVGGGSEAQYAHEVCRYLKPILERHGHEAMVFSAAETAAEWTEGRDRNGLGAMAAVQWRPHLCLSIHSDAASDKSDHFSALMCYQEERSRPIAQRLLDAYCRATGYRSRGLQKRTPGVNGVAVLRISEAAGIPAVLLERGWHDREPDATDIRTRSQWFAQSIARAVLEVYGEGGSREEEVTEPMRLELDRKEGDVYVYELCLPAQPDDLLALDADVPKHDVEVVAYAKPVVGPIQQTRWRVAGWANRDECHGTLVYVRQMFPGLQGAAWITIHSPCPLHGGVLR